MTDLAGGERIRPFGGWATFHVVTGLVAAGAAVAVGACGGLLALAEAERMAALAFAAFGVVVGGLSLWSTVTLVQHVRRSAIRLLHGQLSYWGGDGRPQTVSCTAIVAVRVFTHVFMNTVEIDYLLDGDRQHLRIWGCGLWREDLLEGAVAAICACAHLSPLSVPWYLRYFERERYGRPTTCLPSERG